MSFICMMEDDQVGNFGMGKEIIGHIIDGDCQAILQRKTMNHFLYIDQILAQIMVDV